MKPKNFIILIAILSIGYGLVFILFPKEIWSIYGLTLLEGGQWITRYLGSAFIGLGVVNWLARNSTQEHCLRAILTGNFALSITGLLIVILQLAYGPGNSMFWFTFFIYAFLSIVFGYFVFYNPKKTSYKL